MKAYSFSLNTSDWLASPSVKLMSKAERGVYIMLLCTAWESAKQGTLPASEDKVRRLAEMSPAEWAESGECLLEKFPLSECGTYRFNPRLLKEAEKHEVKREIASYAGQKSAEKRAAEKAAKEAADAALQPNGNGNPTGVALNPTDVEESANENPTLSKGKVSIVDKEKLASSAGQDLASPIESSDEPQRPTKGAAKIFRYDNAPVFLITEFFKFVTESGYGHVDIGMYHVRIQGRIKKLLYEPDAETLGARKPKELATNEEWKAFILAYIDRDKAQKKLLLPDAAYAGPNQALQLVTAGTTTTTANYGPDRFVAQNRPRL